MTLSSGSLRGGWTLARRALRWLPVVLVASASAACSFHENLGTAIGEGLAKGLFEGECQTDSECDRGLHCVTGLVPIGGGQCTPGCVSDRECGVKQACAIAFLSTIGECVDSCDDDQDCAAGERCALAVLGSANQCVTVGSSAGASPGGAGGGAGSAGQGADSDPWGSFTADTYCRLLDDGTCEARMGGVTCCPLQGHRYDQGLACVVASEDAPTTLACVPRADEGPATCVYTGEPACYERSREDGSIEVLLIDDGVPADELFPPLTLCAAPPAVDAPGCEP